jgi:DNA-binding MarR family transcriptional regulator
MDLSQATVTGILDRLEARGLLTRERDTRDKRRVLIRSTEAGQRLVKSAPAPLQQQFAARLAEAPPDEQQRIDQVLQQIVEMMSAEEIDASPMLVAGPMDAEPEETADFLATETEDS